jgi:hypothetical protein
MATNPADAHIAAPAAQTWLRQRLDSGWLVDEAGLLGDDLGYELVENPRVVTLHRPGCPAIRQTSHPKSVSLLEWELLSGVEAKDRYQYRECGQCRPETAKRALANASEKRSEPSRQAVAGAFAAVNAIGDHSAGLNGLAERVGLKVRRPERRIFAIAGKGQVTLASGHELKSVELITDAQAIERYLFLMSAPGWRLGSELPPVPVLRTNGDAWLCSGAGRLIAARLLELPVVARLQRRVGPGAFRRLYSQGASPYALF